MDKEYIEREAAERILYDGCHTTDGREVLDDVVELWHMIQNLPAANVVARDCYDRLLAENDRLRAERPVTHGYWKRERNGFLYCSVCDAVSPAEDLYEESIVCPKYCHMCGSVMDMKGGESDE